ncbi:transposase [Streptomyces sp. NPDC005251]|uniref:transposase n=1 Tax=Streptomyces sp. NPDC005251 TaxID=3157166 RepID=UPI00339F1398
MGRRRRLHDRSRSPARRRGPSKGAPAGEPANHALGRSRGGLTTKIHLAADSRCRPLAFVLTPGQAGDAPAFAQVMTRLRVPRRTGRPRVTPDVVLADKTSHADKSQAAAVVSPSVGWGKAVASS